MEYSSRTVLDDSIHSIESIFCDARLTDLASLVLAGDASPDVNGRTDDENDLFLFIFFFESSVRIGKEGL
jgi:hypothetical protein